VINSATPETDTTTHYFWSVTRCLRIEDTELSKKFKELTQIAFDEDAAIIEAQQRMVSSAPAGAALVNFRGDNGGVAARRIIRRVGVETVCGQALGGRIVAAGHAVCHQQDDGRAQDGAYYLGQNVPAGVPQLELLGQQESQRDRRVDVAAGNRADHVHHCQQGQPEGERDAQKADLVACQYRRTTATDHEHERAH